MKHSLALQILSGIFILTGLLLFAQAVQWIIQICNGKYAFDSARATWRTIIFMLNYACMFFCLLLITRNVLHGFILTIRNIRLLRLVGVFFVLMLFCNILFDSMNSNFMTIYQQHGVSYSAGSFVGKELAKNIPVLIMILLSLLFAATLSEALRLKEEQELTI